MVQVVNMLVTPAQAEQLSLASNQTSIQLVLRNPLDHEIAKTPGTALRICSLVEQHRFKVNVSSRAPRQQPCAQRHRRRIRVVAPAPPKDIPFVMEIISGPNKREQKFGGTPEVK